MLNFLISFFMFIILPSSMPEYSYVNERNDVKSFQETRDIDYTESFEETANTDRGFYYVANFIYGKDGNSPADYSAPLIHMRTDISAFGSTTENPDGIPLTQNMLDALDGTLLNMEKRGICAIIRFAYDPHFSGGDTFEPELDMILKHQEQLGSVLSKHPKAVAGVETGLLGKWGELHSSVRCNAEYISATIRKWLEVLPDNISLMVRTPGQYALAKGIALENIDSDITDPDDEYYRVGMYDDGYMGTWNDIGTYSDREKEVRWLSFQTKHALFGGELMWVYLAEEGKSYSAAIEKEAFQTHTSYLNISWDYNTIQHLREEIYDGKDRHYHGQSGFTYIQNHLGYRFVLRRSRISRETAPSETFAADVLIDNVGFANIIKPKKLSLVLSGDKRYIIPLTGYEVGEDEYIINCDPLKWDSKKTTSVRFAVHLPEDMVKGEYIAYLKVSYLESDTGEGFSDYPVQFANAGNTVYNNEIGANYIGRVRIV